MRKVVKAREESGRIAGIRDLIAARDARLNGWEPRKPGKLAWARQETETQHDGPIPEPRTRFYPRHRYRPLCLISLRWRLSDVLGCQCQPAPKHVILRLLMMDVPVVRSSKVFSQRVPRPMVSLFANHRSATLPCWALPSSPGWHSRHRRWARRNFTSLGDGPVFPELIPCRCDAH